MDFGTGQLKVTPAHDPNDFEIGRRHELDQVSVIGEDGRMTAEAGERFAGLTVMEARAAVVAALREEGRIVGEEPYEHEVPYSHRSGERIEPLISLQWFMRMDELAAPAIDAVRDGRVRIVPENHRRVYLDWMEDIRPWCISRQLWWGHRLPVYYCEHLRPRPRRGQLARSAAQPAAGSCARRRTCSTRGSPRRCGRSPRSGGPSRRRSCAPSTPPRCSPPRATSSSCGWRG